MNYIEFALKTSVRPRLSLGGCDQIDEWRLWKQPSVDWDQHFWLSGYLWRWPVWGPSLSSVVRPVDVDSVQVWDSQRFGLYLLWLFYDYSSVDGGILNACTWALDSLLFTDRMPMEPEEVAKLLITLERGQGSSVQSKTHDDGSLICALRRLSNNSQGRLLSRLCAEWRRTANQDLLGQLSR